MSVCATLAHGDLHERIDKISAEIKTHPKDANLLIRRADLYRQHQEYSKALVDIRSARSLRSNVQDRYVEAIILLDSGNIADARSLLNEVIAEDAEHSAAVVARARAHTLLKNDAAAAKDYAAAAALLSRPDPDLVLEHARCLLRMEQSDAAIVILDEAMRRLGPLPSLQHPALELEVSLGRYEAALVRVASLETGAQMRYDLMQLRGEILMKANRVPEARETFEFALAALENQPTRMNPRTQAIRTTLRAHLQEIYSFDKPKP